MAYHRVWANVAGDSEILNSPEVANLEVLLEEATRSSQASIKRFIEPAAGTLTRATSRTHHLVFGRRGSGKSSLLRKAAQDLTVDRRPIAFVDLESFKGHEYPDVLISVLVETLIVLLTGSKLQQLHPQARHHSGPDCLVVSRSGLRLIGNKLKAFQEIFVTS